MARASNLYFIAIIPDEKVSTQLTAFKQDFADRFDSKRALRLMPHITLKIPFRLSAEEHKSLVGWFRSLSLQQAPFSVDLDGFGKFTGHPAVYVKPVTNPALLNLQKQLINLMRNQYPKQVDKDDEEFTPHMTIAYRDLSKQMFKEAWKEYESKSFKAKFDVNEIFLLHLDPTWKVVGSCKLM